MDDNWKGKKSKIAIIGTGLIGCSMAEGLRESASEIIGVDNNTGYLQEALYRGWIDRSMSLEKAAGYAEIIIISVPVDALIEMLPGVLSRIGERTTVIDTGSIKGAVCKAVENHPNRERFVAAHPMAGLALSGPDASDARLFRNKKVIICEKERSSARALGAAFEIFEKLGMEMVYMEPGIHDFCVAKVSHLPQLLAYSLSALTAGEDRQDKPMINIAATGYESTTRLASSPAGMWIPIFQHNHANISGSLDEMIAGLSEIREMIHSGDWQSLERLIKKANGSREQFMSEYKQ